MSKKTLEIVQKNNADKKEDDIKSQNRLAEMDGLKITFDQKKLLQDQASAFTSKFAIDAGAATAFASSSIQKMLKEVGEAAVGQSHFQDMMKNFAETYQVTGVNEEINKLFANNLHGISTKLSDILPKENIIAPSYASLNYFPSPQERMANELAESNLSRCSEFLSYCVGLGLSLMGKETQSRGTFQIDIPCLQLVT